MGFLDTIGIVVFVLILLAALALLAGGVILFKKRTEWFIRATGIIISLLGGSIFLTAVIGLIARVDPFIANFVQIGSAIGICITMFWVAMLVDVVLYEKNSNEKLLWAIIIIFVQIIGALIYLLVRRPQRIAENGQ
jgi:hypothetical protein